LCQTLARRASFLRRFGNLGSDGPVVHPNDSQSASDGGQFEIKRGQLMRAVSFIALAMGFVAALPISSLGAQAAAPAPAAGESPAKPAAAPLDAGEGRAVADKLAGDLVKSFVYRDQAESYAAMLRKNAAVGRYDSGSRAELAKLLTDDLQAVHVGFRAQRVALPSIGNDVVADLRRGARGAQRHDREQGQHPSQQRHADRAEGRIARRAHASLLTRLSHTCQECEHG